jgi:hypothetical protein
VATFTAPSAGNNGYAGDVEVTVESLKVEGSVMELRFTMTPLTGPASRAATIYDMWFDDKPVLSDVDHLTQYFVLTQDARTWSTSVAEARTTVGKPVLYQAWFAAPPKGVTSLDLSIDASWPTVNDVPVTWS